MTGFHEPTGESVENESSDSFACFSCSNVSDSDESSNPPLQSRTKQESIASDRAEHKQLAPLERLPNELLHEVWVWSSNVDLLDASRILRRKLSEEKVIDKFFELALKKFPMVSLANWYKGNAQSRCNSDSCFDGKAISKILNSRHLTIERYEYALDVELETNKVASISRESMIYNETFKRKQGSRRTTAYTYTCPPDVHLPCRVLLQAENYETFWLFTALTRHSLKMGSDS